ncbi:MAG TPA: c-type cytochrome [Chloroflexota bacterium]|nr:c-type cytochrome [Chloroflexota bacterium]
MIVLGLRWRRQLPRLLVLAGPLLAAACLPWASKPQPVIPVPGGDPEVGRTIIRQYGCGACHIIPGVTGADGLVGPPLIKFGYRTIIAGSLPNTPEYLIPWVRFPQRFEPGSVMPNMGVSEAEARHIAAYLYTLR